MPTAAEYQEELLPRVRELFPAQDVRSEWAAFTGYIHQYSPRVDIAVGPFNIDPGPNRIREYNTMLEDESTLQFLQRAFAYHEANIDMALYNEIVHPVFGRLIRKNQNARCFIAFEIENRNSKKHILGSVINAASLGRIGIGVAYNEGTLRTFARILNYLSFLKRVEKNTYDTTNFMILTAEQLNEILS